MAIINVLDSKIFNRIAAGEVVDRPASVIKELIENSIDANATEISVSIVAGGTVSIIVTDNGLGVEKEQLKTALLPHATSKIASIDDLNSIKTLGFRGEALPSIASVSKFSLSSKPQNQEIGAKIYSEGGENVVISDCALANGTEVVVNNLFFNTPAREKFLKSPRSEESEITLLIARFILGNPHISFKYYTDGKLTLSSFGDSFESAFVNVYGANAINECHFIDTEKNGIKISGYICKPEFAKGNRSYQTLFINNRIVMNETVSSAIANAYSPYLMTRRYPYFVINLKIIDDFVDCNVHPSKMQVRFQNNQVVYGTIYSVISKVLDGTKEAVSIISEHKENSNENKVDYDTHNQPIINDALLEEAYSFKKITFADSGNKKEESVDIFAENKAYLSSIENNKAIVDQPKEMQKSYSQEAISIDNDLRFLAQALNTFLILEDDDNLYFIDQHAAHERLIFDKLCGKVDDSFNLNQPLLVPFDFNVNTIEAGFIRDNLITFNDLGIEIKEMEVNKFSVLTIPVILSTINLSKFFNDVLCDIELLKTLSLSGLLKEKIAQKACKSAVKSGDYLTDSEIKSLILMLKKNFALKCPHGRPIAIKISRMEIDKWFKRIV